jgi:hypothetical protein
MIKMTQRLWAGAITIALCHQGFAQDLSSKPPGGAAASGSAATAAGLPGALPEPLPAAPDFGVGGGVLEALPRPRDLPASLFAPPAPPKTGFLTIDAPYLACDPLLDPGHATPPGWFGGVEIQVVKPHLIPGLVNTVANPQQKQHMTSTTVALPSAALDWTVSPRVFLGYRLPSGFGEFMVSYRHLGTDGSGSVPAATVPTALSSRLAFDMIDVDYNSREFSLGPRWDMKWTFGLRTLFLFFDSQFSQPFGQAAAGNGVFQARQFNNLFGMGPHAALELARRLGDSGWSLYARGDFAGTFDGSHEGWFTRSTTLGAGGQPLFGATRAFGHQAAPIINARAGVTWQPSPASGLRLFVGYQYEIFWDLDRVNNVLTTPFNNPSKGTLWDQGIVFQATFRY